ncbi:MAG: hypothetical protein GEU93_01990 [Propionibacteriales bacterium]|nr:hypothetical protein [Propionibacteriales bacterium]
MDRAGPPLPPASSAVPPLYPRGLLVVLGVAAAMVLLGAGTLLAFLGVFGTDSSSDEAAAIAGDFGEAMAAGDCAEMKRLGTDALFQGARDCSDESDVWERFGLSIPADVELGDVEVSPEIAGHVHATVELTSDDGPVTVTLDLVTIDGRTWLVSDFDVERVDAYRV